MEPLRLPLEAAVPSPGGPKSAQFTAFDHPGTALLWFFTLVAIVVLNMLVAMMTSAFQDVWEAQELNFQYLFGKLVLDWEEMPVLPRLIEKRRAPF